MLFSLFLSLLSTIISLFFFISLSLSLHIYAHLLVFVIEFLFVKNKEDSRTSLVVLFMLIGNSLKSPLTCLPFPRLFNLISRRIMAHFRNDSLDHAVNDYYDMADFEDDNPFLNRKSDFPRSSSSPSHSPGSDSEYDDDDDDDFEDTEPEKSKTDTTAAEARSGKDIQGIPWERLTVTREQYRETRLEQYKNYENLSVPRDNLEKEYLQVKKGSTLYDFQFNTRLVKSTIVHFQLRNLISATSKHDVYLMQNYSVVHWSSLLRKSEEIINVAKPVVPTLRHPGVLTQSLSRVQISTMAVNENLMVAGGFHGELICKYLNQPGVAFCTKLASDENITNTVDVFRSSNGSLRVIAANNDAQVRIFNADTFACTNCFSFDWSVNNTSASPDGKLLAVLGDSPDCLIADAQSGKVVGNLKGHLDYSFSSAWHPDGHILATGNQDTTCRLWDIRNLSQSMAVLKGRMGAIRALKFTTDGRFLAMAEPADFVHIFDTKAGYVNCQEIDLFGEIAGLAFSPDTEALFVGVADRTYGSLMEFSRRHYHQYLDSFF